jgi:hypothetical protein
MVVIRNPERGAMVKSKPLHAAAATPAWRPLTLV